MERMTDRAVGGQVVDQGDIARQTRAVGHWALDSERSTVGFATRTFWGLLPVRGGFAYADGSVEVRPDGAISASLDIDAASVDTGQAKRDEHLRSKDFFDVERFPTMRVEIDRVRLTSANQGRAHGRITILGETRPFEMAVGIALGSVGDKADVTGSVTLDRSLFGMSWSPLRLASKLVTVTVELAFARTDG